MYWAKLNTCFMQNLGISFKLTEFKYLNSPWHWLTLDVLLEAQVSSEENHFLVNTYISSWSIVLRELSLQRVSKWLDFIQFVNTTTLPHLWAYMEISP